MGREDPGGVVASSELCDFERYLDPRSLSRTLYAQGLSARVWEFYDSEGVLELRVRGGLGTLLRRNDARRGIRERAVTIDPVEGGVVEGLPVYRLLLDAHAGTWRE